jgi:hypothetical protein
MMPTAKMTLAYRPATPARGHERRREHASQLGDLAAVEDGDQGLIENPGRLLAVHDDQVFRVDAVDAVANAVSGLMQQLVPFLSRLHRSGQPHAPAFQWTLTAYPCVG